MRTQARGYLTVLTGLALVWVLVAAVHAQEPKRGGRLIIATQQDPITMLGAISPHLHTHMITDTIFNGLVRQKWGDARYYPDLAERWEIAPDGKTYRFHLVRNATWHDGKPFTSADVKFTIEEVTLKNHPAGRTIFGALERVDTPDPYTVVLVMKQPDAPLMSYLASKAYVTIVPKHLYEGTDIKTNPHNFKPIGTGPFKFQEYVKGSHVRVVRHDNYFRKGMPYLDEIIIRIIPDWSAMVAAFEAGEVSYMCWGVPRHELARLQKLPEVVVDLKVPINSQSLWTRFNLRHEALGKLKVRQAIAHATDKKEILEKAFFNQGRVAESFVNPDNSVAAWAYEPKVPVYDYDPQKANALLDEAGFPRKADGVRFSIRQYTSASDIEAGKANEILREQWRRVGIDLKVMPLEGTAFPQLVYNKWDFDMAMGFWPFGPDPGLSALHMHSRQIKQGLAPSNIMGYSNSRVDELFDKAAVTVDQKQRATMYGEIARLFAQDVPVMWFVFQKTTFVFNDHFVGLPTPPFGYNGTYDEIWSKKGK